MALKFAFLGTPHFASLVLGSLIDRGQMPALIITQPLRGRASSAGRPLLGAYLAQWAARNCPKVPLLQPTSVSDSDFVQYLSSLDLDLILVAAYGQILRPALLQIPKLGCLNVHTSLLPKWRGAAPVQRAILSGDESTGVTIMHIAAGLDTGDIALQRKIPIACDTTTGQLEEHLALEGGALLATALEQLASGQRLPRIAQSEAKASYAKKFSRDDGQIQWGETAEQTHRRIRAATPHPVAWTKLQFREGSKRVNIAQSSLHFPKGPDRAISEDGRILLGAGSLLLPCSDTLLAVHRVQVEGRRWVSAEEFAAGYRTSLLGVAPSSATRSER